MSNYQKLLFLFLNYIFKVPHLNYVIAISEICKVRDDDLTDFDVYKLKATNDYIKTYFNLPVTAKCTSCIKFCLCEIGN